LVGGAAGSFAKTSGQTQPSPKSGCSNVGIDLTDALKESQLFIRLLKEMKFSKRLSLPDNWDANEQLAA